MQTSLDEQIRQMNDEEGSKFLPRNKEATFQAAEAVKRRKGLIFVEGPLGSGKSTLAECLANALSARPFLENPDDPEVKRYLSMLYSNELTTRQIGAVGVNNRYLSTRMLLYEEALTSAQSVVIDRHPEADDIYMQGFVDTEWMTEEEMHEIQSRRRRELDILRPKNQRTAPLELVIQITGPAEVFYERKNRRAREVEVEGNGKGVTKEYIRKLTERYEALPKMLESSGFTGTIVQVGQVVKDGVYFDPSSGRHLLPILEFVRDYFRS